MDDAMTTPTVVERVPTLEPTTRDDFADEPAEHRRPPRLESRPDPGRDEGQPEK
jgi:hypothetical protein